MDDDTNKKIHKLLDEIREPLKELQQLKNQQLNFIKSRVKYILINKVNNKQEIEKILDELLELAYWDSESMKDIFYKLINYYKEIDKDSSKSYEQYYIEILKEEVD